MPLSRKLRFGARKTPRQAGFNEIIDFGSTKSAVRKNPFLFLQTMKRKRVGDAMRIIVCSDCGKEKTITVKICASPAISESIARLMTRGDLHIN